MYVLRLDHLALRTCALALAESARRRPRGDEQAPVSRNLARTLAEHVTPTLAKGESFVGMSDAEAFLLRDALREAADAWPLGGSLRYHEQAKSLRHASPESVLSLMEA